VILFINLRVKTLLWALEPMAMAVVIAAVIDRFAGDDEAARNAVQQRDTELARFSADRLTQVLSTYARELQSLAGVAEIQSMDPARLELALEENRNRLFALGHIVVSDVQGSVVWPLVPIDGPQGYRVQAQIDQLSRSLRPAVSDVFRLRSSSDDVFMVLVLILGDSNELNGVLGGVANIRTSLLGFSQVFELKVGQSGFAYLVDSHGRVIYHRDNSLLGRDFTNIAPVARAMGGETGAVIAKGPGGQEVVSGFAPVPGTGWALITQERWSKAIGSIESRRVWQLSLLIAGGVISGALILFSTLRTLRPIKQITLGAQRTAEGDLEHTINAPSSVEVQTQAQRFIVNCPWCQSPVQPHWKRCPHCTKWLPDEPVDCAGRQL